MESSNDSSASGDAEAACDARQSSKREASLPSHQKMHSDPPPTKKAKTATGKRNTSGQQPKLPAEVMGSVFDFMPYGEVRSALLAGKFVAMEAVKHVRTVNIMVPSQMNVPAIRRFPNVEEVNILCLLSPHDVDDDEDMDRDIVIHAHSISSEVASRIPSFLAHVSKLRRTFVGGPTGLMRNYGYHHWYCIEPRNHKNIFRGLLEGCVAAFKNEAFPSTLSLLNGISNNVTEVSRGRCVSTDPLGCTICRDLCVHFPIADAISLLVCEPSATCLNTTEMLDAVSSRKGGKTILAENSADILLRLVNPLKLNFVVGETEVTVDFTKRMQDLSVWPVPVSPDVDLKAISIKKVPNYTCEKLSEAIKYGFDPRSLSRD